jgi:methyl-accepting chemotaxis protein
MRPNLISVPLAAEGNTLSIPDYRRKAAPALALAAILLATPPVPPAWAADGCGSWSSWGWLAPVLIIAGVVLAALVWRMHQGINRAVADLESCTRKMADGNLQALVSPETKACRMSGRIGENVNELALNLQEVLLLVWNLSRQDLEALERAETMAETVPDPEQRRRLTEELAFLRHDLQEMKNIVHQFEFYNVIMQEEKLLAKPEPATSHD